MALEPRGILDRSSLPILITLAIAVHWPVLGLSFFGDDFHVLYRAGVDRDLGTGSFFRPLADLTHALSWWLAGPNPWAFRVVNVAILGVNGWLVLLLTRTLPSGTGYGSAAPWTAALLFVLYPFHREPQLWIVGRGVAMATTFTLAALVIARSSTSFGIRALSVALCAALGTLCYESALLLPLLLLALWPVTSVEERPNLKRLVLIISAVILLNLVLRVVFTGQVANAYGSGFFQQPWHLYPMNAVKVLARLFLPPVDDERVQLFRIVALFVLLIAGGYLVVRRSWKEPALRIALVCLAVMLAMASIIPVVAGVSTRTGESDRFLYAPSVFVCMLVALAIPTLLRKRWRMAATILLVAGSTVLLQRGFMPWYAASSTVHRVLEDLQGTSAPGTTYVVGLPGDIHGAYAFRNGFEHALLMHGLDTARIQRRGPVLEIRSGMETARNKLVDRPDGALLITETDTTFVRPFDEVLTWRDRRLQPLEPLLRP